jgi:hypothetical protein
LEDALDLSEVRAVLAASLSENFDEEVDAKK